MSYLPSIREANEIIERNRNISWKIEDRVLHASVDGLVKRIKNATPDDACIRYTLYESTQLDQNVDFSMLDRCAARLVTALQELGFHVQYNPHMVWDSISGPSGWAKQIIVENMFAPERADWGYKVNRSSNNSFPTGFDIFAVQGHGDKCLEIARETLRMNIRFGFVDATEKRVSVCLKDGWMCLAAKDEQCAMQRMKSPYTATIEKNHYILTWN